jgi:hypothetical protein
MDARHVAKKIQGLRINIKNLLIRRNRIHRRRLVSVRIERRENCLYGEERKRKGN